MTLKLNSISMVCPCCKRPYTFTVPNGITTWTISGNIEKTTKVDALRPSDV